MKQRHPLIGVGPALHHVGDDDHLPGSVRATLPLPRRKVIVHSCTLRIIDVVIDDHVSNAALEERITPDIVRIQVAYDRDTCCIVVNERALECSPLPCVELLSPLAMMQWLKS